MTEIDASQRYVDLSYRKIPLLNVFYPLPLLKSLNVSHNPIKSLKFLDYCTGLRELFADCTLITSLYPIENHPSLYILVARENDISEVPACYNLIVLDIFSRKYQLVHFSYYLPYIQYLVCQNNAFLTFNNVFLRRFYPQSKIVSDNPFRTYKFFVYFVAGTIFVQSIYNCNYQDTCIFSIFYIIEDFSIVLFTQRSVPVLSLNQVKLDSAVENFGDYAYESDTSDLMFPVLNIRKSLLKTGKKYILITLEIDGICGVFAYNLYTRQAENFAVLASMQTMKQYILQESDSKSYIDVLRAEMSPFMCTADLKYVIYAKPTKISPRPQKPRKKLENTFYITGSFKVGNSLRISATNKPKCFNFYVSEKDKTDIFEDIYMIFECEDLVCNNCEDVLCDGINYFNGKKAHLAKCDETYSAFIELLYNNKKIATPLEIELLMIYKDSNCYKIGAESLNRLLIVEIYFSNEVVFHICPEFIKSDIEFGHLKLKCYDGKLRFVLFEKKEGCYSPTMYDNVQYLLYNYNQLVYKGKEREFYVVDSGTYKCIAYPLDIYDIPMCKAITSALLKVQVTQTFGEKEPDLNYKNASSLDKEEIYLAEYNHIYENDNSSNDHDVTQPEASNLLPPAPHMIDYNLEPQEIVVDDEIHEVSSSTLKQSPLRQAFVKKEEMPAFQDAEKFIGSLAGKRQSSLESLTTQEGIPVDYSLEHSDNCKLFSASTKNLDAEIKAATSSHSLYQMDSNYSLSEDKADKNYSMSFASLSRCDTVFGSLYNVKLAFDGTNVKNKLKLLKNKLKAGAGMIMDVLNNKRGIIEYGNIYFYHYFIEINSVFLLSEPRYLNYEFSLNVQLGMVVDAELQVQNFETLDGKLTVSRKNTGGWILVIEYDDATFMAAVPICTKFQIIYYKDFENSIALKDDFIRDYNESDSAINTFVLSIEGFALPFNASSAITGSLNKALYIAYSEVVGAFSEQVASNKTYSQLTINRIASIKAYQEVFDKAVGHREATELSIEYYFGIYDLLEDAFEKQKAILSFFLQVFYYYSKPLVKQLRSELLKLYESEFEVDYINILIERFFQYPILSSYEEFKTIEDARIHERFMIIHSKLSQKLSEAPLPIEMSSMIQLKEEIPDPFAPEVGSVYCSLIQTNGETIEAKNDYITPFKLICKYEEFTIDVTDDDFLTFLEFLPYFVNGESQYKKLPKQFYLIVYYFRRLLGEIAKDDDDEPQIATAGVSYHLRQDGRRTIFVHGVVRTDEAYRAEVDEFASKLRSVYGETILDQVELICGNREPKRDENVIIMLKKQQLLLYQEELFMVEKATGLPFMYYYTGALNLRDLSMQAGCYVSEEYLTDALDYDGGSLRFFYAPEAGFEDAENSMVPGLQLFVKILHMFFQDQYQSMGDLFLEKSPMMYSIYQVSDIPEDENLDYEKSMSDAENNAHPYRGKVDEMNEDNEELQEALAAYYQAYKQADNVKAEVEVYKKTVMFCLYLVKQEDAFVEAQEYYPVFWEYLQWSWETPMSVDDLGCLKCQYFNATPVKMEKVIENEDLDDFEGIEEK